MGLVTSKDDSGRVILGGLPQDVLDYKGRTLRDALDACLGKNMWYFTIGAIILVAPISVYYKTERPLIAAALMSPIADMQYGTWKCTPEKEAFLAHFKKLQEQRAEAVRRINEPREEETDLGGGG